MTKIGILLICIHVINILLFYKFQLKMFFYIILFLPFLIMTLASSVLKKTREHRFLKEFYYYLITVSISMKIGNSFRVAIKESLITMSKDGKVRLNSIIESVVFSQQTSLDLESTFSREIQAEFIKIDKMSHRSLYRIGLWINKLEKQFEFRHKSGQIMNQLYIQAGILMTMYIALFVFVVRNYGFKNNIKIIIFSVCLFLMGLVCSFLIGKRIKWKF